MKIKIAETDREIKSCFPVMVQLRPDLAEKQFLERVTRQQKSGYNLTFVEDEDSIVCVAGFRITESLSWGKFMYVDDLITDSEHRSKGYGDKILDWLIYFAKAQKCQQFHLDSGVQRHDAHRFYLRKRLDITAHHFALVLMEGKR